MSNTNPNTAILDVSLGNDKLYGGCSINERAGKAILETPKEQAINIIGRNARHIIDQLVHQGVEELTLTGAMAIWAYLIVFHLAAHRFRAVYYDDGRPNGRVLVSLHP